MRILSVIFTLVLAITCTCHGARTTLDGIYRQYRDVSMPELRRIGQELFSRNSMDSALAVYTIISNRFETEQRPEDRIYAVEARNSLGVISFINSNYVSAYSNFITAVEMDGRPDAAGNLNLSAIYLYYGDQKKAYSLLKQVFDEAISKGHYYHASAALINMLSSDIDSSVIPPDTIANIIRKYNSRVPRTSDNPGWELAAHISRANLFRIKGNYKAAIDEFKASVSSSSSLLIPSRNQFASYIGLGKTFYDAAMPDSAVLYMKKAEALAREQGFTELLINAYASLQELYEKIGDRRMANVYRYKKLEMNDSVFNTREFGKIRDLEMFHETDKFEKRINILQIEEKMRTRILVVVCVALLLVIVLCLYIFVQYRRLRQKDRNLFERNVAAIKAEERLDRAIHHQAISHDSNPVSTDNIERIPTGTSDNSDSSVKKYTGSALSESRSNELEERILEIMSQEKLFCREGFSIKELADLCQSNSNYISQVLNRQMNTTFTQLLNERRIAVAQKRFVDFENYGHLTIEAIVADLGFRSRSTFSKTFKRITGLSPSEFQRMARYDKQ